VIQQKPRPAVPTLGEAKVAGNTSNVDVDVDVAQQLLIGSVAGDSLPNVRPSEARPDGSVGEE
jgi:hypothetical protein